MGACLNMIDAFTKDDDPDHSFEEKSDGSGDRGNS